MEQKTDKKFLSTYKLPAMEDSKITAENPAADVYGETTKILTREELAKLL